MADPKEQPGYFETFSCYLLAWSLRKLYKRAVHWSSQGFHYYLNLYTEEQLGLAHDSAFSENNQRDLPTRRDTVLADYFLKGKNIGLLASIMQEHPDPTYHASTLPYLTTAFETVVSSEVAVYIYCREICIEFHQFLVALLRAYTKSVQDLNAERANKAFHKAFYNLAIFFWKVARSHILHIHIHTLFDTSGLAIPNDRLKWTYASHFMSKTG
jgi:hypothetical protein